MAKVAKKVADTASVSRVIDIPGWVYNLLIDRAKVERRDVKQQIERELEDWAKRQKEETQAE